MNRFGSYNVYRTWYNGVFYCVTYSCISHDCHVISMSVQIDFEHTENLACYDVAPEECVFQ